MSRVERSILFFEEAVYQRIGCGLPGASVVANRQGLIVSIRSSVSTLRRGSNTVVEVMLTPNGVVRNNVTFTANDSESDDTGFDD